MRTEERNERSRDLHKKETSELLRIINEEDKGVAEAVEETLPDVERVVEEFVKALRAGGRVFYVGAGTSGRLGVLDAAELHPTFSMPKDRVIGVIAGGERALVSSQESREDRPEDGARVVEDYGMSEEDFVIGISASGRTPFVEGCLKRARAEGAGTAVVMNNPQGPMESHADIAVKAITGPEVLAGSTRMKAGTAQKMILNMISTAAMVRLGKVYDNLMVDLVASNSKLKERARRILSELTEGSREEIEVALERTDYSVKHALLMVKGDLSREHARRLLEEVDGHLERALDGLED